jgi:hypothetical protein
MCDNGCSATFTASNITVTNGKSKILTGLRDKESSLWRVPLEPAPPLNVGQEHSSHNVYEQKSIQDTITYFACVLFHPRNRHVDQIHPEWTSCNMAICHCEQCT